MTSQRPDELVAEVPQIIGRPAHRPSVQAIESWYFLLPTAIVFAHAYSVETVYRTLAYLNIVIVLLLAVLRRQAWNTADYRKLAKISIFPLLLVTLHVLATANLADLKDVRHIAAVLFVALGLWKFSGIGIAGHPAGRLTPPLVAWAIFVYALTQGIAVLFFSRPFGTTKNPHYLAQYCMLFLPVSCYLYLVLSTWLRVLVASSSLILLALLLQTSSRPAWLALFCAALLFAWFERKKRAWTPLLIAAVVALLYFSNAAGFGRRVDDLVLKISSEERVTIWHDTFELQKKSSPRAWLVGHGLTSFKADFQPYSSYHREGINFRAPHNYFLELLYTTGIFGLLAALALLYAYYKKLLTLCKQADRRPLALTVLVVLTANLLFGSITLPFLSSYNILALGIIGGMLLALDDRNHP